MHLEIGTIISLSDAHGSVEYRLGDIALNIKLAGPEIAAIRAIGLEAFRRQQRALADSISCAQPVALADYTEVEF